MPEEPQSQELTDFLGVPRKVLPIDLPPGMAPPATDANRQPLEEPQSGVNSQTTEQQDLLYVMGASKDGSNDPDNHTAPPAKSALQTDTYKSWRPPLYKANVNIGTIHAGTTTTIDCSAAHNIPATGGPYLVTIAGVTGNTPSTINGKWWATYVDSDTFTIPLHTTIAGTGGTVGLYCNGVKVNEWVRFYKTGSGSGIFTESVWTRSEKIWNKGSFYVSEETLANVAVISGSGSGSGGLPI